MKDVGPNFLDFVPKRKVECRKGPDGGSVLLVPKFGRGKIGRFAATLLGDRSILKIHLDELGSRTWNAIDGSRTVGDIAGMVQVETGGCIADLHERCARFMRMLYDARAVGLDGPCAKDVDHGV